MNIKKMKMQLVATAASVLISGVALTSATYAWYVSNNSVTANTTTISATTNGFILQIAEADKGAQHGGNDQSLSATTLGGKITPSSTSNLEDWYICLGWDSHGNVTTYTQPTFSTKADAKPGEYEAGGEAHYAYLKSEYILYTMTETGLADVYLDSNEGKPITVAIDNGKTASSTTIPDSMRIALTTQPLAADGKTPIGTETLRVVYAPTEETGKGNDAAAENGMTCIATVDQAAKLISVPYSYIYDTHYSDQNGKNWSVIKEDEDYVFPTGYTENNSEAIAKNVGYNGILLRTYIWMEGTDADCVNNSATEDEATYSVTLRLAGIASNGN